MFKMSKRTIQRLLSIKLSIALLAGPALGLYADELNPAPVDVDTVGSIMAVGAATVDTTTADATDGEDMAMDWVDGFGSYGEPAFSKASGVVSLIDYWNDMLYFRIVDAEGGEADFVIDEGKTVITTTDGLTVIASIVPNAEVDVYFVKPLIMTMQYPPRYTASVVTVHGAGLGGVFVGIIDEDSLASDGSIKLTISDATLITLQSDGAEIDALPEGYAIIAYHKIMTASIPPMAPVEKVVVLDEMGIPVFVNGMRLINAEAALNADGVTLVPLRAVVESLGHNVEWDDIAWAVRVGVAIYVKIGSDEYTIGRAAPIKLDAKAELIDGKTYVPLSFFEALLQMKAEKTNGLITLNGGQGAQ